MAESIGSIGIGASDEAVRLLQEMSDSIKTIAEHMEKAGDAFSRTNEYVNNINMTQQQMMVNVINYNSVVNQVQNNYTTINELNQKIYNVQQKSTDEVKEQVKQLKQLGDEGKSLADRTASGINSVTSLVKDPFKELQNSASSLLDKIPGGVGKIITATVALGAAVYNAGLNIDRFHEKASRKAGLGPLEAMGGLGNAALFDMRMIGAETQKLSSKEEYIGAAGALIGQGGMRGEQLMLAMEDLPRKTHEAGLGFVETATQMARLHRVTGDAVPDLKDSFDRLAATAKDSKYPIQDYVNSVVQLTLESKKYGGTLAAAEEAIKSNYKLVMNGTMTQEEYRSNIEASSKALVAHGVSAEHAEKLTGKLMDDFGTRVGDLSISWSDLIGITEDMRQKFGLSDSAAMGMAKYLTDTHEILKVSTADLRQWHSAIAQGTVTLFDSPKEAAYNAAIATRVLGKQFDEGVISTGDYVTIMKTQKDVFRDSGEEVISKFRKMAEVVDKSNIRMEEQVAYITQSAKIFKQYGIDEMGIGTMAFQRFNQYVREGAMAVQDYQAVLKGPSGATEGMRAVIAGNLSNMGGPAGEAFKKTGVLGSIDILMPAIQMLAAGGDYANKKQDLDILEKSGISKDTNFKALQGQIESEMRKMVESMTMGGSPAETLALYKRLFPTIYGTELTARGGAVSSIMNLGQKGELPEQLEVKKDNDELVKAHKSFVGSSKDITTAAGTMKEAANKIHDLFAIQKEDSKLSFLNKGAPSTSIMSTQVLKPQFTSTASSR